MSTEREVLLGFVSTQPGNIIRLSDLLEKNITRGVSEMLGVFGEDDLTQDNLVDIARLAFGVHIKPEDIFVNNGPIRERDKSFAKQFGSQVVRAAYAGLNDGKLETWIQPVLIPNKHDLSQSGNRNSVLITRNLSEIKDLVSKDIPIRSYGETRSAHYVCLTVKDTPGVLAKLAQEFGNQNISIKEVRQPEGSDGKTEIAFILWPCETRLMQDAVSSIGKLDVVSGVNAVFRAIL